MWKHLINYTAIVQTFFSFQWQQPLEKLNKTKLKAIGKPHRLILEGEEAVCCGDLGANEWYWEEVCQWETWASKWYCKENVSDWTVKCLAQGWEKKKSTVNQSRAGMMTRGKWALLYPSIWVKPHSAGQWKFHKWKICNVAGLKKEKRNII